MKQARFRTALKCLEQLYETKGLPFSLSKKLFMLKREIQPHVEHEDEQRVNVLKEWDALNPDNTLNVTTENVNQINAAYAEIAKTEVEWGEPVKVLLTPELVEKMGITGKVMDDMEGFISFEMEGDE